jgi:cell division protein FtsB
MTTQLQESGADRDTEVERLRAEVARLRRENHQLRATLDAYIARAASTSMSGPLEMTAGTCVGPRTSKAAS